MACAKSGCHWLTLCCSLQNVGSATSADCPPFPDHHSQGKTRASCHCFARQRTHPCAEDSARVTLTVAPHRRQALRRKPHRRFALRRRHRSVPGAMFSRVGAVSCAVVRHAARAVASSQRGAAGARHLRTATTALAAARQRKDHRRHATPGGISTGVAAIAAAGVFAAAQWDHPQALGVVSLCEGEESAASGPGSEESGKSRKVGFKEGKVLSYDDRIRRLSSPDKVRVPDRYCLPVWDSVGSWLGQGRCTDAVDPVSCCFVAAQTRKAQHRCVTRPSNRRLLSPPSGSYCATILRGCLRRHTRMQMFRYFATVQIDGTVYMRPTDFVRAVIGGSPHPQAYGIDVYEQLPDTFGVVTPGEDPSAQSGGGGGWFGSSSGGERLERTRLLSHSDEGAVCDSSGLLTYAEFLFLMTAIAGAVRPSCHDHHRATAPGDGSLPGHVTAHPTRQHALPGTGPSFLCCACRISAAAAV